MFRELFNVSLLTLFILSSIFEKSLIFGKFFFSFTLSCTISVSYTHLRAHETSAHLVCRLLLEKKNEIMDKINSFFGYKCISNVVLKIVHDTVKPKKNFPKIKDFSKIEDKMNKVNNDTLKSSLNNFLKAFNERNN